MGDKKPYDIANHDIVGASVRGMEGQIAQVGGSMM